MLAQRTLLSALAVLNAAALLLLAAKCCAVTASLHLLWTGLVTAVLLTR